MFKLQEPFSEELIDDDAALSRKKSGKTHLLEQHVLRLQPIFRETLTLKPKKEIVNGKKDGQRLQTIGRLQRVHAFPTGSEL